MADLTDKNFGLLIAYVLPGFVTLLSLNENAPIASQWIRISSANEPTVGGFLYVTLASVTCGMVVSAVRWLLIDTIHHKTGINGPKFQFSHLDERISGFLVLVENHYRYAAAGSNCPVT